MTLALRILLSIPLWLLRLIILLLFAIPGFLLIPSQAHRAEFRASKRFPERILPRFVAWWMAPYQNDEDGIDGLRGGDPAQEWWAQKTANWSARRRVFVWSALRNPVDSLRWVPILNPMLVVRDVRYVGMDHEPAKGENGWYFAWIGIYSCIRVERWGWRFWLGWKLKPDDVNGLQAGDVRAIRCDFACQLKRVHK